MKIVDRINEILKEKNMSKKELAERLIALDMKAHKTGEVPSLSGIYAYLNGNVEIKADMVSYIAEALGVWEQELFIKKQDSKKIIQRLCASDENYIKYAKIIDSLEYMSPKTIELLERMFEGHKAKVQSLNAAIEGIL